MAPNKSLGSLTAMAKDIRKKVAAVKPTSLPGASAFKSAERVEESDTSSSDDGSSGSGSSSDSENGLVAAKKKLEVKNAAKKAATSKPQVNGKPTKTTAATVATAKAVAKKPAPISSASDTSSSGSDSDSDSDSDSNKETVAQAKKIDPAEKSDVRKGSDSSDESDESDAGAKVQSIASAIAEKAAKVNKNLVAKKPAADVESSESEDEEEPTTKTLARAHGGTESTEVVRPEWLNKSDFMLRKATSDHPGKEVSEFLSKSNLEGKQVWYFTAPASLPITVIEDMEIDLAKAQSGGAILNHKGDAYGLDLEPYTTSSQIQLLIPSKGGEKYNTLNRAIDSTIHLRRIAEFGGASKVSATATDQYVRKQRPARQQPKDLKPRFTPIGVPTTKPSAVPAQKSQASKPKPASSSSSSDSSDSDVEMTDAATLPVSAVSMKSAAATKAGSKLKRKQSTEDSDSDSDTSSSDSDDEPAPALEAKSKAKPAKRAKTAAEKKLEKLTTASAPAVQGENTRSSKSQLSLAEVKKATPVPPPSVVRTFSQASAANETPSKAPESSKDKKDKKSKKTAKSADGATTSIKQTPIPVPTWGKGN